MESNVPATRGDAPPGDAPLVVDTVHDIHADHRDPQQQDVQQNMSVALLPLALITLLVLSFIAAAWTFIAALPPA